MARGGYAAVPRKSASLCYVYGITSKSESHILYDLVSTQAIPMFTVSRTKLFKRNAVDHSKTGIVEIHNVEQ